MLEKVQELLRSSLRAYNNNNPQKVVVSMSVWADYNFIKALSLSKQGEMPATMRSLMYRFKMREDMNFVSSFFKPVATSLPELEGFFAKRQTLFY